MLEKLRARFKRLLKKEIEKKEKPEASPSPPPSITTAESPKPSPVGSLVVSSDTLSIDAAATVNLAKAARIQPHQVAEIVPGVALRRDGEGRIHIKIVFYGPSLSGKTTALRWLFANVRALSKGKMVEISDPASGRTTFFDFIPVTAGEKIVFDVFTVAGQRRHAMARITVLRDVDALVFMADSMPEQMNENLASIQELRIALGTDRLATMPLVVSLNKRDLPNALPVAYMIDMLDLEGYPVFETISTTGLGLLPMFKRIMRDALIFKIGL
jgi:signal recognition particle receptor subunit beta